MLMIICSIIWKKWRRQHKNDYRDSFLHYYVPKAQIKDFDVLIDGKSFFDLVIKNEEEAYEKIIDMSNNNDYMAGNLLDLLITKKSTDELQLI